MVIKETSVFTRQVLELLPDDDYWVLQSLLVNHPEAGKIIPGGGGIRKIRWAAGGQGKRGGVRVIYYWAVAVDQILMLYMYPKSQQANLSHAELKVLRQIVEEEYP